MTAQDATTYAPVLAPSSGLHWARRKTRDHAPAGAVPTGLHIANAAGRLICDMGPSVSRGVDEPTLASEVHALCLDLYRRRCAT